MRRPSDTAIHEAGHAVVAHLLHQHVHELVVKNKTDGYCKISYTSGTKAHKPDPVIRGCVISAGHLAEVLWCGRNIKYLPATDLNPMEDLRIGIRGMNELRAPVEKALKKNRALVMRVARALESHPRRKLNRREFLKALRG